MYLKDFIAQFKRKEFWLAQLSEVLDEALHAIEQEKSASVCLVGVVGLQEAVFCQLISPLAYADALLEVKNTLLKKQGALEQFKFDFIVIKNSLIDGKLSYYKSLMDRLEQHIADFCEDYSHWYLATLRQRNKELLDLESTHSKKLQNHSAHKTEMSIEKTQNVLLAAPNSSFKEIIIGLGVVALVASQCAVAAADNLQADADVDIDTTITDEAETYPGLPQESGQLNLGASLSAELHSVKIQDNNVEVSADEPLTKPKIVLSSFRKAASSAKEVVHSHRNRPSPSPTLDAHDPMLLQEICREVIQDYTDAHLGFSAAGPITPFTKAIIARGFSPPDYQRNQKSLAWYPVPRDGADSAINNLWRILKIHSGNSAEVDHLYAQFLEGNNDCFSIVSKRYANLLVHTAGTEAQIAFASVWALLGFRSGDIETASYFGESMFVLTEAAYAFTPELSAVITNTYEAIERHIEGYSRKSPLNTPYFYLLQLQHEALYFASYHQNPRAATKLGLLGDLAETNISLSMLRRSQAYFAQAMIQDNTSMTIYLYYIQSTELLLIELSKLRLDHQKDSPELAEIFESDIKEGCSKLEIVLRFAYNKLAGEKADPNYSHCLSRLETVSKSINTIKLQANKKNLPETFSINSVISSYWHYICLLLLVVVAFAFAFRKEANNKIKTPLISGYKGTAFKLPEPKLGQVVDKAKKKKMKPTQDDEPRFIHATKKP